MNSPNFFVLHNISLESFNTLKITSLAKNIIFPLNEIGFKESVNHINEKIVVIGKGSNILFSRIYYDDICFLNTSFFEGIKIYENQLIILSGTKLSDISWFCASHKISGYEFLEDIPGTIGGAISMNAGTYGKTISDLIIEIKIFDINKNQFFNIKVDKSLFTKRQFNLLSSEYIIISAVFKISETSTTQEIMSKINVIKEKRFEKQPRNYPNAGSVFKRISQGQYNLPTWEYIDSVGLRGYTIGGAQISKKHSGFMVNLGDAKPNDFINLISLCQERVFNKFGINLELEWKII